MKFHIIFQLEALVNILFTLRISYLVIGFRDSFRVSVIGTSCISSSNAPSKALVDGGYFKDNRTSSFLSSKFNTLSISKSRRQDVFILVSGIFFMYLIESKICNRGIFFLVMMFFCLIKDII